MQECLQLMFITTFSFKNRKDHFNAPFQARTLLQDLATLCMLNKNHLPL